MSGIDSGNELLDALKERLNSPVAGSYVLFAVAWNYDAVLTLFLSREPVAELIEELQELITVCDWILPLIATLLFLAIHPWVINAANLWRSFSNHFVATRFLGFTKEVAETNRLIEKFGEVSEKESELAKLQAEIERLDSAISRHTQDRDRLKDTADRLDVPEHELEAEPESKEKGAKGAGATNAASNRISISGYRAEISLIDGSKRLGAKFDFQSDRFFVPETIENILTYNDVTDSEQVSRVRRAALEAAIEAVFDCVDSRSAHYAAGMAVNLFAMFRNSDLDSRVAFALSCGIGRLKRERIEEADYRLGFNSVDAVIMIDDFEDIVGEASELGFLNESNSTNAEYLQDLLVSLELITEQETPRLTERGRKARLLFLTEPVTGFWPEPSD